MSPCLKLLSPSLEPLILWGVGVSPSLELLICWGCWDVSCSLELLSPSLESLSPSLELLSPSLESLSPSLESLSPSLESLIWWGVGVSRRAASLGSGRGAVGV